MSETGGEPHADDVVQLVGVPHADDVVQLVCQATGEEFREATQVLLKASPAGRNNRRLLIAFGLFPLALNLWVDRGAFDLFPLLFAALFLSYALVFAPRLQAKQAHRRAQAEGPRYITVDPSGLTVATAHQRQWSGWPTFSGYVETPRLFVVLSADKKCMTFLPKHAVQPAGEPDGADRLRRILARHLPPVGHTGQEAARSEAVRSEAGHPEAPHPEAGHSTSGSSRL
ncbi:hypothetical protein AB0M57_19725 [Streptomyces sp. NPDC051597]|uniref:hypothetical protein n=1 Tax=Streptomyces sp. NPDC051597 TaxID=3155049 RepID=UPI0034343288